MPTRWRVRSSAVTPWLAVPRLFLRAGAAAVRAGFRSVAAKRGARGGVFLAAFLEALGPTFIKIGQVLSCRPDLLPESAILALRRLQDRVAPIDSQKVPALVEQSLGRSLDEVFAWFDPLPVSSASVAVVHRASLHSGELVAVKILRPGLAKIVQADLAALRFLAGCLERLPPLRRVPMRDSIDEFGRIIGRQLDFTAEAENNRRFRRNFASQSNIRIPVLVDHLCTDSVLTMEFFEGLENFNDLAPSSEMASRVATLTLRALFKMIFEDGFIHADMHPGNVFLMGDDRLALLDTGLVAELAVRDQRNFASFFFGMVSNKGRECARILHDTATFRASGFNREEFDAEVVELVHRHFAKTAREFEVTRFAGQLFAVMRRRGLRGSTKFITTILSLVVFEGVAKQIDPGLDFQAEARRYIPMVLRALLGPANRVAAAGRG